MKRCHALLAGLLAVVLAGGLLACTPATEGTDERVVLRISASATSGARSVLPSFTPPASYKLTVSQGPSTVEPMVSSDGNFNLEIDCGTYDFLIEGYSLAAAAGDKTCSGGINDQAIEADATLTVTVSPAYASGEGSLAVSVFWPSVVDVDSFEYALMPAETDPAGTDWVSSTPRGNYQRVAISDLAAGNYDLHFRITQAGGNVVQETSAVQIAANLASEATIGLAYRHFMPQAQVVAQSSIMGAKDKDGAFSIWGQNNLLRGYPEAIYPPDWYYPNSMGGDWAQVDVYSVGLGIKNDGTLWSWGKSGASLGRTTGTWYLPSQVNSDTDWLKAEAGYFAGAAIKTDGSLWIWGIDNSGWGGGYLGVGSGATDLYEPTRLGSDSDWVDVSFGGGHALALKSDGTLWTWGIDTYGQLGNGEASTETIAVPVQVGTDTDWARVYGAAHSSFAIKNDGTLYAWGLNSEGRLGIGSGYSWTVPTQVGTGSNWKKLACDGATALAIQEDGTLWAWGYGNYGAIGWGSTSASWTPVQVGTDNDWFDIASSDEGSAGMKTDGSVLVWGTNTYALLGDGTTETHLFPVPNGLTTHTVSFNLNGAPGTAPASLQVRHNALVTALAAPTWALNVFTGWHVDLGAEAWTFASDKVTSDITLMAKWELESFSAGLSVLLREPAEESISLGADQTIPSDSALTVIITETFDAYRWYVDGIRAPGSTGQSISRSVDDLSLGRHNLVAMVRKDGLWYSKSLYFTVVE